MKLSWTTSPAINVNGWVPTAYSAPFRRPTAREIAVMRLGVTPSRSRTSPTKRFATGPENSVGHQVSGVLIAERRLRRSTIGSPYRGRTASVDGGGLLLLAASFAMPRRENDARVHSISGY